MTASRRFQPSFTTGDGCHCPEVKSVDAEVAEKSKKGRKENQGSAINGYLLRLMDADMRSELFPLFSFAYPCGLCVERVSLLKFSPLLPFHFSLSSPLGGTPNGPAPVCAGRAHRPAAKCRNGWIDTTTLPSYRGHRFPHDIVVGH